MTDLSERIAGMITRESLISDGGRVVIALSGGSDSVALTVLMCGLARRGRFEVVGVAHLNHQLRAAADDDERFCRQLAEAWSLPIEVEREDVMTRARRHRVSVEEAGHQARYEFFDRARATFDADGVATAHTRNDQAETVLMRLLRGAGPGGLSGIHPRSGRVIRPLLDISRMELRAFLAERGQTFCEDETNRDLGVTRNRVRHELIPLLEQRFSPSVVEVLARDAAIARHDATWLDEAANTVASKIVLHEEGPVASFGRELLLAQPVALARRVAKQVLERVTGTTVGFAQINRLVDLLSDDQPRVDLDFPGCRVSLEGDRVVVGPPGARETPPIPRFEYCLTLPGEVDVPEAQMTLSARYSEAKSLPAGLTTADLCVYLDAGKLSGPLVVRSWRPGDWLKPLGLGGRKKVQDVFVDRKVARETRQTVPIVADTGKGIVWVVGHTVSEDFRVTSDIEGMLILKATKLGGAG